MSHLSALTPSFEQRSGSRFSASVYEQKKNSECLSMSTSYLQWLRRNLWRFVGKYRITKIQTEMLFSTNSLSRKIPIGLWTYSIDTRQSKNQTLVIISNVPLPITDYLNAQSEWQFGFQVHFTLDAFNLDASVLPRFVGHQKYIHVQEPDAQHLLNRKY